MLMRMERYKTYKHNPPHLFRSGAKYFITAATYGRKPFFSGNEAKERLFQSIRKGMEDYGWRLEDWVILDNHYHLMADAPEDPTGLSRMIRDVHRFTALWVKKHRKDFGSEKRIWYNYWDTCITYERSYFARLNYIWHNPVKHGYVRDAGCWRFGSYFDRVRQDRRYVDGLRETYPFDGVHVEDHF